MYKQDVVLNNLQELLYYKPNQPTNQPTRLSWPYITPRYWKVVTASKKWLQLDLAFPLRDGKQNLVVL